MNMNHCREYYSPNDDDIIADSDSHSIQNAVNTAEKSGSNQIVIPRMNARTGKPLWLIDESVLLPSNMTVILDNCHIRLADGSICNVFRNSYAKTPHGTKPENVQQNIRIIGKGAAILDGGEPNCLNEFTCMKNGLPHISENLTIYFHNVENFELEGFTVKDQRWWAMAFMFARNGRIANLHFRLTRHQIDTHEVWRNQDGINLRVGCSNIILENLEGEVGDDFIALTALNGEEFEQAERVENAERDIHDIIIRDIRAVTNQCAVIRLLNHFGQKIYNVSMRSIYDVGRVGKESPSQMTIRIGDPYYYKNETDRVKLGELHDIDISDVYSRSMCGIRVCDTVKNMTVRNIHMHSDGGYAFASGLSGYHKVIIYHPTRQNEIDAEPYGFPPERCSVTEIENVVVENVFYEAFEHKNKAEALFGVKDSIIKNMIVRNVYNSTDLPVIKYFDDSIQSIRFES